MEKLISMTDFVIEQNKIQEPSLQFRYKVFNYAKFLKQILEIWMFVPAKFVNGEWVVLEEPMQMDYIPFEDRPTKYPQECYEHDLQEYEEAQSHVLFEGCSTENNPEYPNFIPLKLNGVYFKSWDIKNNEFYDSNNWTIEKLIFLNLVLTESAKQKIFNN